MTDPALWGATGRAVPAGGGARGGVLLCPEAGLVLKRTAWDERATRWLVPVLGAAARAGFAVPRQVPSRRGRLVEEGWRCETLVAGRAAREDELRALASRIGRFHGATRRMPQRPGWPRALAGPHARRAEPGPGGCVIHGDLNPGNVLIGEDGPALVDWEEARRDLPALDLLALGAPVPARVRRAHLLREVALCWEAEPGRARRLSGSRLRGARRRAPPP